MTVREVIDKINRLETLIDLIDDGRISSCDDWNDVMEYL